METLKRTKFEETLSPVGIRYYRSAKAILGAAKAKQSILARIAEGSYKLAGLESSTPL